MYETILFLLQFFLKNIFSAIHIWKIQSEKVYLFRKGSWPYKINWKIVCASAREPMGACQLPPTPKKKHRGKA